MWKLFKGEMFSEQLKSKYFRPPQKKEDFSGKQTLHEKKKKKQGGRGETKKENKYK